MYVSIISFGYNYGRGIPRADLIIDCRCLQNPHREARGRDGRDAHIAARVVASDGAPELLATALLALTSGKVHSVAFGCSWGTHRSVAMAEVLAHQIRKVPGVQVAVFHRDLAIRDRERERHDAIHNPVTRARLRAGRLARRLARRQERSRQS